MKAVIALLATVTWMFATVVATVFIVPIMIIITTEVGLEWFYFPANFWKKINQDL